MTRSKRELTLAEIQVEEDALTDFQFAIIDAMNAEGLSQTDLAKRMGVSKARISQLLSPEANPTLKLVGRALHALGLRAQYSNPNRALENDGQDFWQQFVAKIESTQTSRASFTPDQVSIYKSRASVRASLWDTRPANENAAATVKRAIVA